MDMEHKSLQPVDNEAVIGIFRVDGTAKPELDVLKNFSKFVNIIAPHLEDYERSEISLHKTIFIGFNKKSYKGALRLFWNCPLCNFRVQDFP